jgi:competence protein ComEA
MYKIIILIVVATIIGLVAFASIEQEMGTPSSETSTSTKVDEEDNITVTLTGEVTRPGTYYVPLNSTLGDAIDKASGTTSNADYLAFNTSFVVESGMSFYIAPLYDNSNTCSVAPLNKVNINTADKATLMNVPGFGDAVSSALITYRDSHGLFQRIEEIKDVPGIGEATFSKAKNNIQLRSA